jgi:hypothetical protein
MRAALVPEGPVDSQDPPERLPLLQEDETQHSTQSMLLVGDSLAVAFPGPLPEGKEI